MKNNLLMTLLNKIQFSVNDNFIQYSSNKSYPRFDLGYNQRFFATNNKIDELVSVNKKNYNVFHKFSPIIDNYEDSLSNIIKQDGEDFYVFYELCNLFNLIEKNFIVSVISPVSNDIIAGIKQFKNVDINVVYFDDDVHIKNNDVIEQKKLLKSDLIIINSNKNDIQINLREQETINYNLKRIMHALLSLNKNGNLVCKFYETFTLINLKLIYFLTSIFDKVYLSKPLSSSQIDVSKYIVCLSYNGKNIEKVANVILDSLDKNIYDIFINDKIDNIDEFVNFNISIGNLQYQILNEIIDYIKSKIFSGDVYYRKRDEQIEATKLWLDKYWKK